MIYQLKDYQIKANEALKDYVKLAIKHIDINQISSRIITFKAPTGSGKTFIITSLIEDLCSDEKVNNVCFVWACPGKGDLHKQSHDAVKTYLGGNPPCSLLEDEFFGNRKYIRSKEVVFVNWEKLVMKDRETGKWANNLMKDQEGINFIDVIEQTKKNGTKIILIVDESHIGTGANARTRVNEFIDTIIDPPITIEMSATPVGRPDVVVEPQDVIDEGMIKVDVITNEGIFESDKTLAEKDSEQLILQKGFDKREELKKKFAEIGAYVNPLVLIQIPNTDAGEAKKEVIRDFLSERGVTEDNGKLKLWCDDHAIFDKKAIKKNNDITEYLIFKTAVATGWDCPRAHVLIKFRDGNSETFEIQTVGRILRTPEAKSYNDSLLDNAYIFTNVWKYETKHDSYNPNRIKTAFAKMRDGYSRLRVYSQTVLESYYRSRMGDYNSADSNYTAYFIRSFMKFFGLTEEDKTAIAGSLTKKFIDKGMNLDVKIEDQIMEETVVGAGTIDNERTVSSGLATVTMSDNDIQAQYYSLISENLNGLAYVRSKSPINSAIIDCFTTFYNVFPRNQKVRCYQQLVVKNSEIFAEILSESTRDFREKLQETAGKKGDNYKFYIDETRPYSEETHMPLKMPKSLYQPLYVLKDAHGNIKNFLEKSFLDYLEGKNCVEWYWENGTELMRVNFGISYNGGMNTFQPDFIVRFKNNVVGIFDTKAIEERVEDTTVKANALFEYIKNTNATRGFAEPKVVGGIVIKTGSQFYLYQSDNYHDYNSNHDGWINFNELIRDIDENDIEKILEKLTNNLK